MASVIVLYWVVVDLYTGRERLQRTNRKTQLAQSRLIRTVIETAKLDH